MGAPVTRAVTFKLQPRRQTKGLRNRGGFFFPEPTRNERPDSQTSRRGSYGIIRVGAHEDLATSWKWWICRQGSIASVSPGGASFRAACNSSGARDRHRDHWRRCNHGDRGAVLG